MQGLVSQHSRLSLLGSLPSSSRIIALESLMQLSACCNTKSLQGPGTLTSSFCKGQPVSHCCSQAKTPVVSSRRCLRSLRLVPEASRPAHAYNGAWQLFWNLLEGSGRFWKVPSERTVTGLLVSTGHEDPAPLSSWRMMFVNQKSLRKENVWILKYRLKLGENRRTCQVHLRRPQLSAVLKTSLT